MGVDGSDLLPLGVGDRVLVVVPIFFVCSLRGCLRLSVEYRRRLDQKQKLARLSVGACGLGVVVTSPAGG